MRGIRDVAVERERAQRERDGERDRIHELTSDEDEREFGIRSRPRDADPPREKARRSSRSSAHSGGSARGRERSRSRSRSSSRDGELSGSRTPPSRRNATGGAARNRQAQRDK